jgi:hypothetical protein
MQQFLSFEIATAIKDRPKIFQLITLALFSFSVTVIFVSYIIRFSQAEHGKQALRQNKAGSYAGFVATPAKHLIGLEK